MSCVMYHVSCVGVMLLLVVAVSALVVLVVFTISSHVYVVRVDEAAAEGDFAFTPSVVD